MIQGPVSGDADSARDAETSRGDPALIGRMVSGKYKIEKFLGGGAMGAVYKARFAALEKNVAVKVMHRAIAADANFVGRFHREAKAASRLDHPNSMRVIDFGEEPDGLLYITMEYVEGRDLYRVIHEDWPISNADIGDILMQALAAVAVAHEMGVIHRDLKPENLMMLRAKNDDGHEAYLVKVCDFGIAKITEKDDEPKTEGPAGQKLTTQGLVVGTPEYMSPEQARGEKLDARSDIYSIGVILYQLLTGRTPFSGDTPLAVVLKHITESPPAPSVHYAGVHKGLEAVTLKALAKDRNERFQTARAMRNAIRESLDGSPQRPMPVDISAPTVEAAGSGPALGTTPMGGAAGAASAPMIAQGMTSPGAATRAPMVAGEVTSSHLTPLGTAAAPPVPKKSRAGLVLGLGVVALLAAGGVVAGPRLLHVARGDNGSITPITSGLVATSTPSLSSSSTPPSKAAPSNVASAEKGPSPTPSDAKTTKHTTTTATGARGGGNAAIKATAEPAATPEPAAVAPAPPPDPTPPPPVTAPTAAPAPAPAPVFNPQTCRATTGTVHSSGATNAKDLVLNGTAAAWTSCAQRSIHEKPGAPISANVHVQFSDTGQFRGASCASCPPALGQCIAGSSARSMALKIRGGDVTGDPAFDVPVNVTCD